MPAEKTVTRNSVHEEFYRDFVEAKERFLVLERTSGVVGATLFTARNYDWMSGDDVLYVVRYISLREIAS